MFARVRAQVFNYYFYFLFALLTSAFPGSTDELYGIVTTFESWLEKP